MSEDNIISFEKYLNNEMNEHEKSLFHENLLENSDLKEEFEIFRLLHAGVRIKASNDKIQVLKAHSKKILDSKEKGLKISINKTMISTLLILAAIFLLFYTVIQKSDRNKLQADLNNNVPNIQSTPLETIIDTVIFKNDTNIEDSSGAKSYAIQQQKLKFNEIIEDLYINPNHLNEVYRDDPSDNNQLYDNALSFFNEKNYKKSILILSQIDDENSNYLKALCLLKLGKYTEAEAIFDTFYSDDFSKWHEESKYYLLLSLLPQYSSNSKKVDKLMAELENNSGFKLKSEKIKRTLLLSNK